MHPSLNVEERNHLDRLVAEAEKRCGAQMILAIIGRSDDYPELPWRAFALGASMATLAAMLFAAFAPLSSPLQATLLTGVIILSAGASLALLCVFVPEFARLFLFQKRAETETRQYAESLFFSRQQFALKDRRAVLLFVSLFERRIIVLADDGLTQTLTPQATQTIIQAMRADLKAGRTAQALEAGLAKLEEAMSRPSVTADLPNIIEEKGA